MSVQKPPQKRRAPRKPRSKPMTRKALVSAFKRKFPKRSAPHFKEVFKQQSLGAQTLNKVRIRSGRPDSRARIMKAVTPSSNYLITAQEQLTTSGYGGRCCWTYTTLASRSHLKSIGNLLAVNNNQDVNTAPARYLLENLSHALNISNLGNAPARVTLYHCRPKRELYNSMNYSNPAGTAFPWGGDPVTAIQQGLEAQSNGNTSGGVTYLVPGTVPTQSVIFKKYFQIHHETEVLMAVGSSHRVETNRHFDRVADATIYGNQYETGILGLSDFILFKAEGVTGVEIESQGNKSLTAVQVGIIEDFNYRFTQCSQAQSIYLVTDANTATTDGVNVVVPSSGVVLDQGLIT